MRKLLFSRESPCIQPLRELVEEQTRRTLVLWALDCAPEVLALFEARRPQDLRPRLALETAARWATGQVKMPEAKRAIHGAHNAATEAENDAAAQAAARAVGHAAATVHVETHALGLVFYGLTAFAYAAEPGDADRLVEERLQWFYSRLQQLEAAGEPPGMVWAPFLLRDQVPNREKALRLKMEEQAGGRSAKQ